MARAYKSNGREAKRAAWRQRIADWSQSGLSQAEYCRRKGLQPADLSWWKRQIAPTAAAEQPMRPRTRGISFLPVRMAATASSGLEVLFPSGHVLRVSNGVDPETLRTAVAVLDGPAERP